MQGLNPDGNISIRAAIMVLYFLVILLNLAILLVILVQIYRKDNTTFKSLITAEGLNKRNKKNATTIVGHVAGSVILVLGCLLTMTMWVRYFSGYCSISESVESVKQCLFLLVNHYCSSLFSCCYAFHYLLNIVFTTRQTTENRKKDRKKPSILGILSCARVLLLRWS